MKLARNELVAAAICRIQAKWPDVDPAAEREAMTGWSDFQVASAYSDLSDDEMVQCAKLYGEEFGYDSADEGGLCGHSPLML